jgi:mono/diheme cytochrome c family protein
MKPLFAKLLTLFLALAFFACGGEEKSSPAAGSATKAKSMVADEPNPMENKGVGPITSVTLGAEVDAAMAAEGKEVYEKMCTACHKPTEKFIGPAPIGILDRRTPEWVMNMILNPEGMVKEDPIAKKLLMEFNGSPMANQHLTEEQARAVLEYFRTL